MSVVTGTKPDFWPGRVSEVKLAAIGTQGSAKEDSVTVWFCMRSVNTVCLLVGRGSEMYLWVELELDDRANVCFDVLGEELEGAGVVADCDDLHDSLLVCA